MRDPTTFIFVLFVSFVVFPAPFPFVFSLLRVFVILRAARWRSGIGG